MGFSPPWFQHQLNLYTAKYTRFLYSRIRLEFHTIDSWQNSSEIVLLSLVDSLPALPSLNSLNILARSSSLICSSISRRAYIQYVSSFFDCRSLLYNILICTLECLEFHTIDSVKKTTDILQIDHLLENEIEIICF